MKLLYADQSQFQSGPSIFLAGPTPRRHDVTSWRPAAVKILERLGYEGTVLIPEGSKPEQTWAVGFLTQVEWEDAGLTKCTVIAFWIPRDMITLPGLTTNIEFGRFVGRRPMVYGRPDGAPHTGYLDWLLKKETGQKPLMTLEDTMKAAMAVKPPSTREMTWVADDGKGHEFSSDWLVCVKCGLLYEDIVDLEKGGAKFTCSRVA